jgi:hypothetical protein
MAPESPGEARSPAKKKGAKPAKAVTKKAVKPAKS